MEKPIFHGKVVRMFREKNYDIIVLHSLFYFLFCVIYETGRPDKWSEKAHMMLALLKVSLFSLKIVFLISFQQLLTLLSCILYFIVFFCFFFLKAFMGEPCKYEHIHETFFFLNEKCTREKNSLRVIVQFEQRSKWWEKKNVILALEEHLTKANHTFKECDTFTNYWHDAKCSIYSANRFFFLWNFWIPYCYFFF